MATAPPRGPRTSSDEPEDSRESSNLAARIYGTRSPEPHSASRSEMRHEDFEAESLAARVYGDPPASPASGAGHSNNGQSGGGPGNGNGRSDSNGHASFASDNLAARIYDRGGDSNRPSEHPRALDSQGLAARVYGAPVVQPDEPGTATGDLTYNLAERIHEAPASEVHGRPASLVETATGGDGTAPPPIMVAAPERAEPPRRGLRSIRTFESLGDRDFRWFFFSMFGHFASMNTQMFIRGYLVFQLTGSFAALGLIFLANAIGGLGFSLIGGVIADAVPQKKRVVQIGQFVNAGNALWIAVLIAMRSLQVEHLFAASFIQGVVNSLMMPSRQAMTPEVVGMDRLMNAMALNTAGMNFNRLMMPGLAGWMLSVFGGDGIAGAEYLYFGMAALYLSAVLFLFKVPDAPPRERKKASVRQALRDISDGWHYVRREPVIRMLLLVNLGMVAMSMPYMMLLAGWVVDVLDGGASDLGLLQSIGGIGALVGSLTIASLPSRNRGKLFLAGALLLGSTLLLFSMSTTFWLTAAIMVAVGVGQSFRMSLSNVLIQSYVEDEYRGRVMSIYMMEFSITSFGTFLIGILAEVIGPQIAIGGTAAGLVVLTALLYLFSPRLRALQ